MNRRVNRASALFLALVLLLSCAACGGKKNAFTSMHLMKTEGTVQVADGEGKSVKPISNLGLYSGYGVTTQAASYGWISLDTTKLAKLDEKSGVEVQKSGKQLELYVRSGGLFFNVTEPLAEDETMNIRTSSMVVGIRGTCGWVEVEDESLMCVYLLKGQVECSVLDDSGKVLATKAVAAGEAAKMVRTDGDASITVAEFDAKNAPEFVGVELEGGEAPGPEPDEPGGGNPSGDAVAAGTDGNISWSFEDGVLTISGTGDMENYGQFGPPWNGDRDAIQSVVIKPGVTSIGTQAFSSCVNITSVTIPDSVTSIGDGAFSYCPGLTSVTIPGSVISIGDYAFSSCYSLTSATIPDGVTSIGKYAFGSCGRLTSVEIPSSVTSIGDQAFLSCSGLTSVTILDGVTAIGTEAFYGCSHLTSVEIPSSVTSIGNGAFASCSKLTGLTIPDGVTSIGKNAFVSCGSLTSVEIPFGVTSLGERAFFRCLGLTSVTVPDSVTTIGKSAFGGCDGLADVYFSGTPNQFSAITIEGDNECLLNATIHYLP